MAHADFRGTLTYLAVFKMMISSKNVNQNMLKIPYFFEKIWKNSPNFGGFTPRSQLASGCWELCPQTPSPVQSYPHLMYCYKTF